MVFRFASRPQQDPRSNLFAIYVSAQPFFCPTRQGLEPIVSTTFLPTSYPTLIAMIRIVTPSLTCQKLIRYLFTTHNVPVGTLTTYSFVIGSHRWSSQTSRKIHDRPYIREYNPQVLDEEQGRTMGLGRHIFAGLEENDKPIRLKRGWGPWGETTHQQIYHRIC